MGGCSRETTRTPTQSVNAWTGTNCRLKLMPVQSRAGPISGWWGLVITPTPSQRTSARRDRESPMRNRACGTSPPAACICLDHRGWRRERRTDRASPRTSNERVIRTSGRSPAFLHCRYRRSWSIAEPCRRALRSACWGMPDTIRVRSRSCADSRGIGSRTGRSARQRFDIGWRRRRSRRYRARSIDLSSFLANETDARHHFDDATEHAPAVISRGAQCFSCVRQRKLR
jgi:hypothetical protein